MILLIVCLVVMAGLVAGLFGYAHHMGTKTMGSRIKIFGEDVSGLTVEETAKKLADDFQKIPVTFQENGETDYQTTLGDLGYSIDETQLKKDLKTLRDKRWKEDGYFPKQADLTVTYQVNRDDETFSAALTEEHFQLSTERVDATDAYVAYDGEQNAYVIVPEVVGNHMDQAAVETYVEEQIRSQVATDYPKTGLEIEIPSDVYLKVAVTQDSQELQEKAAALNTSLQKYQGVSITYTFGNETQVLDNATICSWLVISDDSVSIDTAQAQEYIKNLATKYNTIYKPRSFTTTGGETITIEGNEYGYRVDQDGELAQLLTDIDGGAAVTREPVYSKSGYSRNGTDDLNGSYIEVSLDQQHLWLYKNGVLVTETDIISGLPVDGRETYRGAWPIAYKASPFTLSSDVYGYDTAVTYWMPFVYGQGLHDASWQTNFGGDTYKTKGSHGCINLPPDQAKIIYETIDKGYCVLVYNLPGTESDTVKQKEATAVVNTINSIGTVTLESEPVIVAARAAYDALSDTAKSYVTNYQTLVDDEAALAALKSGAAAAAQQPAADQTAPADGSTVAPADPAAQTTDGTVAQ